MCVVVSVKDAVRVNSRVPHNLHLLAEKKELPFIEMLYQRDLDCHVIRMTNSLEHVTEAPIT